MSKGYLKRGDKGQDVRLLQTNLQMLGHKLATDGIFGPATETQVRQFQKNNNLVIDGIAGKATNAALQRLIQSDGKIRILLDAGHGAGKAHNRGSVCSNEGDNNFNYSLVLKAELEKYGFVVDLVRKKITDNPSLATRAAMGAGYDLFISIHSNAAESSVRGTEVWDSVARPNRVLARTLCSETAKLFGHRDRGVKYKVGSQAGIDWYGVLRFNGAKSSMIIENGFHTNKEDCGYFLNHHSKLATVQARVIANHYNMSKQTTTEKTTYVVKNGDTLSSIATRYKTTVDQIVNDNNIPKPSLIHPGLRIVINPPKKVNTPTVNSNTINLNSRVKVKASAKTYTTGQTIPSWVKARTYTVAQVSSGRVLLKEIMSWVRIQDVSRV